MYTHTFKNCKNIIIYDNHTNDVKYCTIVLKDKGVGSFIISS